MLLTPDHQYGRALWEEVNSSHIRVRSARTRSPVELKFGHGQEIVSCTALLFLNQ